MISSSVTAVVFSRGARLCADENQELCEASSSSGLSCPIYLQGLQHNVTSVQVDVSPQHDEQSFSHV